MERMGKTVEGVGRGAGCRTARGFTLMELLVVIVIILIMIGLGVRNMQDMIPVLKVNRAASEMTDVINQGRTLAVQTGRVHTMVFNNVIETMPGNLQNPASISGTAPVADGSDYWTASPNATYISENENGTDHWYALLGPVWYGGTVRVAGLYDMRPAAPKAWRSPNVKHYYRFEAVTEDLTDAFGMEMSLSYLSGNNAASYANSFKPGGGVYEDRIDPAGIQIGPRHLLPEGVRYATAWEIFTPATGGMHPDDGAGTIYAGGRLKGYRSMTVMPHLVSSPFLSLNVFPGIWRDHTMFYGYSPAMKMFPNRNINTLSGRENVTVDGVQLIHATDDLTSSWNRRHSNFLNSISEDDDGNKGQRCDTVIGFVWRENPDFKVILTIRGRGGNISIGRSLEKRWTF